MMTPKFAESPIPNDNSMMLVPPSQTISESLTGLAHSTSKELEEVWDLIGLSPEERADQLTDLLSSFRSVCENKISAEREVADNYKSMIVDYKNEIAATSKALKIPVDEKLLKEDTNQTMQDEVYTLELALEEIRNEAEVARTELIACRDELVENHEALGISIDAEWKDVESDLTTPRVRRFQEKSAEMKGVVATRSSAVVQLIRDSQELIDVMRIDPKDNLLDRKIMVSLVKDDNGDIKILSKFETDDCTGISAKTLKALTDRLGELHSEKRRRKAKLAEMGDVIGGLWEKLHVPKQEQEAFAQSIDGLGLDTLAKGEAELKRLFALKEGMMGGLIEEARSRIHSLWDETNATEAQKATFQSITITDDSLFNDELLTDHENYIKILEQRLDQMRPIIDVIEKRESIVQERMQYEEFLKDPTRLQQRGAALTRQLMKEEKMSRRIKRDLPKYTDHLNRKLHDWSIEHDEPFMYNGEDYMAVMKRQEEEWQDYKENQAQMKRQKKQEERSTYSSKSGDYKRRNMGSLASHNSHGSGGSSSGGSLHGRKLGSTASHNSHGSKGPLQDKTNQGPNVEKSKVRPLSRLRALSRGRNRGEKNDQSRAKSRPRGVGKSKEPRVRENTSRSRGVFSRGRAQPTGRL